MLAVVALLVVVLAPLVDARPASAATACRSIGGASAAADGDHHATVAVDTGSGPVWSACITFSGTISGIGALDLAADLIPDLNPRYDTTYAGQGYAVCQLRGTGNDPPGCLGKSAAYWGYSRNGRYSSVGASSATVGDGDVEGWRWGTSGGQPRSATNGSEAATATAPATTPAPVTTRPAASGTPGTGGTPAPGPAAAPGGAASPRSPGGVIPGSTQVGAGSTTSTPGATTGAPGASTTTEAGSPSTTVASDDADGPSADGSGELAGPRARNRPSSTATATNDDGGGGSSGAGSVIAFAVVLAVAGAAGVLLRRRRTAAVAG